MTLRRALDRSPNGGAGPVRFTGVVGDLLDLDDARAVIETRTGVVEVPLTAIGTARLVLASTADELALARVLAAGWQAGEVAELDGWTLRASGGFSARANSVLPLGRPHRPLAEQLAAAREWYAERGLPLRLQVPREARRLLDAALGEQGFVASAPVDVLAARLDFVTATATDVPVDLLDVPDAGWLDRYRGGAAHGEAGRRVLEQHELVRFAAIRRDGATAAVCRGTVDGEWLGLTALEVAPEWRRRGLATSVAAALVEWGRAAGATHAHAEVAADNAGAQEFWTRLGFWRHHDYHYRSAPTHA